MVVDQDDVDAKEKSSKYDVEAESLQADGGRHQGEVLQGGGGLWCDWGQLGPPREVPTQCTRETIVV